jgi:hypothetical protein
MKYENRRKYMANNYRHGRRPVHVRTNLGDSRKSRINKAKAISM